MPDVGVIEGSNRMQATGHVRAEIEDSRFKSQGRRGERWGECPHEPFLRVGIEDGWGARYPCRPRWGLGYSYSYSYSGRWGSWGVRGIWVRIEYEYRPAG
jgi:hypothetical protein